METYKDYLQRIKAKLLTGDIKIICKKDRSGIFVYADGEQVALLSCVVVSPTEMRFDFIYPDGDETITDSLIVPGLAPLNLE